MDSVESVSVHELLAKATPLSQKDPISRFAQRSRRTNSFWTNDKSEESLLSNITLHTPTSLHEISDSSKFHSETSYRQIFPSKVFSVDGMHSTSFHSGHIDEDYMLQVAGELFDGFLELYKNYQGEHEIFQLLLEYEKICTDKMNFLDQALSEIPGNQNQYMRIIKVCDLLRNERNTWRLLRILYQDRLENVEENSDDAIMDVMTRHQSDKEIIEKFYERNSSIRQQQLILDWLEKNSLDRQASFFDKVGFSADGSLPVVNTLHSLLFEKSAVETNVNLSEIDPDAVVRQKDSFFLDMDKEEELKLLKHIFNYLRSGQLNKAQDIAERYGHPWLAAALEGWRLHHDPNFSCLKNNEKLNPVEGNCYRDIWKNASWRASQEAKLSMYERALYAALSGNLKSLLPACSTWEDYLWAYLRVAVDVHIDQELQNYSCTSFSLRLLSSVYWDKVCSMDQIFQELQASQSEVVQQGSKLCYHLIQKYIILNDINGLIEQMHAMLEAEQLPYHVIRFMAHLVLFFRMFGISTKENLCFHILEAYVKILVEERRISLVASYTSTLLPTQQIVWYAKFLEGIVEHSEKQKCLDLAEKAGLDVSLITKTLVENIRSDTRTSDNMFSIETNEEDKRKIDAIDWLMFDPSHRSEAIRQANAVMRLFVANKKVDAAKEVFQKIPSDSINIIMQRSQKVHGDVELLADDENAIREYLCFQAYLEAQDAFNEWFKHFHVSKPEKPKLPEDSKFKEKVAYDHLLKQYEMDLERWARALQQHAKNCKTQLYNVLLFVNGGWMVDLRTDGTIDEGRQQQMSSVRELCIPRICFLLHTVLSESREYQECFQLINILASEKDQLYKTFSKHALKDLLMKIQETSITLLDEGLDPIGFPCH